MQHPRQAIHPVAFWHTEIIIHEKHHYVQALCIALWNMVNIIYA